ncbi:phasin [Ancylobacter mangrovi]|uniref:Phasin n=1 Tax=Ancylobacter mangrovi TaxID=2972472 RepID=A0A9X2T2W8_9HYPH|nr:phasin [Ancylobacter mangrovi]MCS0494271.1 phasin [Ancylobacter mangrovi]MCS0501002.1 phasin [Ancylobacter mangrovi]
MAEATPVTPAPKKSAKAAPPSFEAAFAKFELPKIDMASLEVPAVMREMAEKSVQSARETYEKLKNSAEETTDLLEDTYTTASKGVTEYNTLALESLRTNVNAAFDYMGALLGAKSVSEAVELSTGHMRKQFDVMSAQAKELSSIAQKVATDTAEPIKASVEKTIKKSAA